MITIKLIHPTYGRLTAVEGGKHPNSIKRERNKIEDAIEGAKLLTDKNSSDADRNRGKELMSALMGSRDTLSVPVTHIRSSPVMGLKPIEEGGATVLLWGRV